MLNALRGLNAWYFLYGESKIMNLDEIFVGGEHILLEWRVKVISSNYSHV